MRRLKAYLPLILWMGVIFTASTSIGSSKHTSRFIGPFLRFFKPDISEEVISVVQTVVRKAGHLSEYAVLAVIWWGCRRYAQDTRPLLRNWVWPQAWQVVFYCALYAVTDELHQRFVAGRQGQVLDVFIDTVGSSCGIFLLWAIGRWFRRW